MHVEQDSEHESRRWGTAILIALVIMGFYLAMAGCGTLWDRDEPRFARATVEMVESGNYLYPTFNGELRPHKPILIYWLMSLPVRILGPSELACRFFAVVGTAVTCLLTFFIGKRIVSAKAGLWAMVILATTLMIRVVGTAATSDAVLLPCMVGALAVFVYAVTAGASVWTIILMGVALGGALLAKGPVGLLPVVIIAITLLLTRGAGLRAARHLRHMGAAMALAVLMFVAWGIPANNATGGEFLRVGIGRHLLHRMATPMEHHGGDFLLHLPYYVPVLLIGFFPWALHLPGAVSAVLARRVGQRHFREFFIAWTVSVFVIMTLVATKLPHYILLMWPAMALAVGGTIVQASRRQLDARDIVWLRRGVWLFAPLAIASVAGLLIAPAFIDVPGLWLPSSVCGIVLLLMAWFAVERHRANRPQDSAMILLVGGVIIELPFLLGVLPAIERVKISPPIGNAVRQETDQSVPVASCRYGEPSLNFYVRRRIEYLATEQELLAWPSRAGRGVLIIPRDILELVEQRNGQLNLRQIASKKGFNYSKGKKLEVLALMREPANDTQENPAPD